jgi:hypothetical protein
LPHESGRLNVETIGDFPKPAEPGNRDSHRVNLGWVCGAFTPTLAGRWRNLAAFLGISERLRFGGFAGEHVSHALTH